ncbi:MAG: FHA domain-containing protein, partial [Planctomycetes bacterium]|nr:FHA domain-containing protein [Planctomycetota bacterium]
GPVSLSAQKATAELTAAMHAQIPEETIAQNLNILNADAGSTEDATIAANLNSNDATIAADFAGSNDDMTIAADFNPEASANNDMTIAADLNPANEQDTLATQTNGPDPFADAHDNIPTARMDGNTDENEVETSRTPNNFVDTLLAGNEGANAGKPATNVTIAENPAQKQSITGDIHNGMNCPWVNLMPSNPGEPMSFMLFAKNDILMGKLRDAPIDLCLRNYPVPIHKAACQRISRQHVRITYDLNGKCANMMDVGSGNGTLYQGMALPPNKPQALNQDQTAHVIVADAVELNIDCIPCSGIPAYLLDGAPESTKNSLYGMDTHNIFDAITISRPSNRPELAYAMVLRQVSIGDSQCNIKVSGADAQSSFEFTLYNGHWIWRPKADNASWQPLTNGSTFQIANRHLIARPGSYQDFH